MTVEQILPWLQAFGPVVIALGAISAAYVGYRGLSKSVTRQIEAASEQAHKDRVAAREQIQENRQEEDRQLAAAAYRDIKVTMSGVEFWLRATSQKFARECGQEGIASAESVLTAPFPEPIVLLELGIDLGRLSVNSGHWTTQTINLWRGVRDIRNDALGYGNNAKISAKWLGNVERECSCMAIAAQIAVCYLAAESGIGTGDVDPDELLRQWDIAVDPDDISSV